MTKINVADSSAVKQALDETTVSILCSKGFKQDQMMSNLKIVLGILACICAYYAYFNEVRLSIAMYCAGYMILTGILQLFAYFLEQDNILVTQPSRGFILRVSTKMEKYSTKYTMKFYHVSPRESWIGKYRRHNKVVQQDLEVNRFFDSNGALHVEKLQQIIEKNLAKLRDAK